jgi:hypothetical protein
MSDEQLLRQSLLSLQVSDDFTEAVLLMVDGTRLCFCHRVGERWAKTVLPAGAVGGVGVADQLLGRIAHFRLNARHLDVQFQDDSRWEAPFAGSNRGTS